MSAPPHLHAARQMLGSGSACGNVLGPHAGFVGFRSWALFLGSVASAVDGAAN
jgi:hypothetical protein